MKEHFYFLYNDPCNLMVGFSIIICTYNPDRTIFLRLLSAVVKFGISSPLHEVIIVDNNSSPALAEDKDVHHFLNQNERAKLIREPKPGLTAARIAGIEKAKFDWIIFFDDDNEPASDYLTEAAKMIEKFPEVGAWGPGKIKVEFINNKSNWVESKKDLFQERSLEETVYGFEIGYQDYYPDGTGLVISKFIAADYIRKVKSKELSLTDRNGQNLTSGGDLQLILNTTVNKLGVGRAKSLILNHNITAKKVKIRHILKLVHGLESCNYIAHAEIMKWNEEQVANFKYIDNILFLKTIGYWLLKNRSDYRDKLFKITTLVGQQIGISILKKEKHPTWSIRVISRMINS